MKGLLTLDGAPVTPERMAALLAGGPARLYTLDAGDPAIDPGEMVVVDRMVAAARGDAVVCACEGVCHLALLLRPDADGWLVRHRHAAPDRRLPSGAIVARVVTVEKGELVVSLGSRRWRLAAGLQARLPRPAADALRPLAALERLRRPLFPPLYLGSEEVLLTQLRDTYDVEADLVGGAEGLEPAEEAFLARHLTRGMRVLDVGCGSGREALAFARAGLAVTGVDLAPRMVATARARAAAAGLAVDFVAADPLALALSPASFEAVHLSTGVYSHIPGRARRIATLRGFLRALVPDGVLSVMPILQEPRPMVSRSRLVDALRRAGRASGIRRLSEPGDVLYRGHAAVPPPGSLRYLHCFTPGELEAELAAGGLRVVDCLGDRTLWVARPAADQRTIAPRTTAPSRR